MAIVVWALSSKAYSGPWRPQSAYSLLGQQSIDHICALSCCWLEMPWLLVECEPENDKRNETKAILSSTKRGASTKRSWLHGKVGMQGHWAATIFGDCQHKLPCTRAAQWPVNFSPVLCTSRPLEAIYQEESLWECKWILPGARTLRRNILLIGSRGHTGEWQHKFLVHFWKTENCTVNTRKGDLRH